MLDVMQGDIKRGSHAYMKLTPEVEVAIEERDCLEQGKLVEKETVKPETYLSPVEETIKEIELLQDASNVYASPNLFKPYCYKRNGENVSYITSLWQDLDNCTEAEAIQAIENSGVPTPTFIVNSGGGVHIYWVLSYKLPAENYSNSWRKVMHYIADKLKTGLPEGSTAIVDTKVIDIARVMRIPTSYNVNRECYSSFISFEPDLLYDFLGDFYTPYTQMLKEKSDRKPVLKRWYSKPSAEGIKGEDVYTDKPSRINYYNQYMREDIVKLVKLRKGDVEGYRNSILFYLHLLKETEKQILYVNDLFNPPLTAREVGAILESDYKNYPKRNTVFAALNITEEEERHMRCLTSEYTAQLKKECSEAIDRVSRTIGQCEKQAKELYWGAYVNESTRNQKEMEEYTGIPVRTLRSYKKYSRGENDFMEEKTRLIATLIEVASEVIDTISLLLLDPSLSENLHKLQEKATGLSERVKTLQRIIADSPEVTAYMEQIEELEKKSAEIRNFTNRKKTA